MALNYFSPIDMNKLEIIEPRIHNSLNAPTNPVAGQIYFDTTVNTMYFYNGTAWVDIKGDIQEVIAGDGLSGGGAGGSVTLNVGAGLGITVNTDTVQLDVSNARNADHSNIEIQGGAGLTGGGTIDTTRTLAVGVVANSGITVNPDSIQLTNYANLTQYQILMWGAGGQLENAPIARTVDQSNNETITIQGNLVVNGTTTTINSNEVNIGDSIILLNSDISSSTPPTQDGGFAVKRGTEATVQFIWDESEERFSTVTEKLHLGVVDTFTPTTSDFFYMYHNTTGEAGEIKRSTFNAVANLLGAPIHFSLDPAQTGVVTKNGNVYTVTHNLGTKAVSAQVISYATQETVFVDVARPTVNTITVSFASTVADNAYYVILIASKRTGDVVGGSVNGDAPDTQNA